VSRKGLVLNASDADHAALAGKLAVVVGGNQGIGAAIAVALARAGCRLVIAARDEQRLAQARQDAEQAGGADVDARFLDVTSVDGIREFASAVIAEHEVPTVLVNSAGGAIHKPILEVSVEDWDRIMATHLRGTFFVGQAFGKAMVEHGYGKIINLSSTWASTYVPGRSVYATAKAGVSHLTTAMAVEWAHAGVNVNAIAPTSTTTPRVVERMASDPDNTQYMLARIPMGRFATPDDIVGAALFLASPASDFVTGQTLYVDGGWQHAK
jgi:NAD(P)-dependent dehydrogenase (short-subunit alcohol dehydrogenase family)